MVYLNLFIEFFKTGLFSVGGGLATLPFLYDIADRYPWFSIEELTDMIAVSESTPGPIGVNMATYAGFTTSGLLGALTSTLSLILPSVIVILIISSFLNKFKDNKFVNYSFYGIRPAVAGLISAAVLSIVKITLFYPELYENTKRLIDIIDFKALILFVIMFVGVKKLKLHPIVYILASAVIGVFLF